ncbi:hypothetical protein DSM112329_02288 [Paraconexibacter sp. AEG42_29]|uniref:Cellulase (Glycosyl hydrolase family 5) n=1 Tax=Paraconexibacter sp. AEG42_29 TaxID=2997339 RepID=A0AAU7AVC8_9ACTN
MLKHRLLHRSGRFGLAVVVAALAAPGMAYAAAPGVNIDDPSAARVDAALATGATHVRIFVSWRQLEPAGPDTYAGAVPAEDPAAVQAAADIDDAVRRLNAGGARPIFTVIGSPAWANGSSGDELVPPTDPATYAAFFARFVAHTSSVGQVAAYEVWSGVDSADSWHGTVGPGPYGALLKAAYAAAKPVAQNGAQILAGPTTGNNATFIEGLYAAGLKGSFDGVTVRTDTACLSLPPESIYREGPDQRIGQYAFLGYRSVRQVMLAHDDPGPRIWMSELGWSSTGGGPTSCTRGTGAGERPSGVTTAQQAAFLTQAYGCLARDTYVAVASWYALEDRAALAGEETGHYGLLDSAGGKKPAHAAFAAVAAAGGGPQRPCGDDRPPGVRFVTPDRTPFTQTLRLEARARDTAGDGVTPSGVARVSFLVDGKAISRFQKLRENQLVRLDWLRAADLPDGPHEVVVEAQDRLGNVSRSSITVLKGAEYVRGVSYPSVITLARRAPLRCAGLTCTLSGAVSGPLRTAIAGRVRIEWQLLIRRPRSTGTGLVSLYVTRHKGGAAADRPFAFTQALARPGRWRVRVIYDGAAPLAPARTPWRPFTVRPPATADD